MQEGASGGAEDDAGAQRGRGVSRGEGESGAGPPHSKGCRTCSGPGLGRGRLPWCASRPDGGEEEGRGAEDGAEAGLLRAREGQSILPIFGKNVGNRCRSGADRLMAPLIGKRNFMRPGRDSPLSVYSTVTCGSRAPEGRVS